jgi:hypothetical protein
MGCPRSSPLGKILVVNPNIFTSALKPASTFCRADMPYPCLAPPSASTTPRGSRCRRNLRNRGTTAVGSTIRQYPPGGARKRQSLASAHTFLAVDAGYFTLHLERCRMFHTVDWFTGVTRPHAGEVPRPFLPGRQRYGVKFEAIPPEAQT